MKNFISTQTDKSLEEMLNDCSIDAIIAIDANKNIIAWNTIAEKIHGKNKHEVMGKPVFEVIQSMNEDEETLKAIANALKGIKSFVPASKKYYHRMHAENHFIPLKDDSSIIGAMNLVHDVAHRIKTEENLIELNGQLEKRNQQLKATADEIASFAYITSTKIKEPIRQIYTGVEHLIKVEAGRLTDSGKATFRRMQSSLNRMDLLIDDILGLSQISILEKPTESVDLNKVMQDVIKSLQNKVEEENAEIIVKKLCSLRGHEKYLHLLFYSLVNNALKFNESKKPAVTVDCEEITINQNTKMFIEGKQYYKITVADNGIGFDENEKEKIFNMFEKLHPQKFKGSGMGLTVARKIVDAHDGFIEVESKPGAGSAFHCYFPAAV